MTRPTGDAAGLRCHVIEGEPGCAYAVAHDCVAVVVDALRASATAAMLLDASASELIVVREVEDAFAVKQAHPDALLFGEREGLPPKGFDCGNSPRIDLAVEGCRIVFTTTTGAGRLVSCWGARAVYMGSTVNAGALASRVLSYGTDVVLIPAGLAGDPAFDAQEDWAAATAIALRMDAPIGEGADACEHWRRRIDREGLPQLFATSPHAAKLRRLGLEDDVSYAAQVDLTSAVPRAVARMPHGVTCVDACRAG